MFVQSEEFVKSHGGKIDDVSIYGQESNPTTWRLAAMNLAIRGFSVDLGKTHGDTFANDQFPDLKFDYIMANPPFNISDWGGEKYENDVRWKYGRPPDRKCKLCMVTTYVVEIKIRWSSRNCSCKWINDVQYFSVKGNKRGNDKRRCS